MKRKHKKMKGGRTWDEWARQTKILSTLTGVASGLVGFIPGVNAIVSPALAGVSGAAKLAGYGHYMSGGAVYTKGQIPLHKMTGGGLRGMKGGNSVYNNVASAYSNIKV